MSQLTEAFAQFHAENPVVYEHICLEIDAAMKRGHRRYSMAAIFEIVRWELKFVTTGRKYNMANALRPYYARMWMETHPPYPDFFVTTHVKGVV